MKNTSKAFINISVNHFTTEIKSYNGSELTWTDNDQF